MRWLGPFAVAVAVAVDAGTVCTREDGGRDLKIAVISKQVAGEPATPDEWHERFRPVAGEVPAFALIDAAKRFRQQLGGRAG